MGSEVNPPTASRSASLRLDRRRQLLIELGQSFTESWTRENARQWCKSCVTGKDAMTRMGIIDAETNIARLHYTQTFRNRYDKLLLWRRADVDTERSALDAETNVARPAENRRRGRCFPSQRQHDVKVEACRNDCWTFVCSKHNKKAHTCSDGFIRWRLTS